MSELESRLSQLGRELDWPVAPDLASAVRERLDAGERLDAPARRRRRPVVFRRSLAIALAALLLLAGGVLAAAPGVRDSVLDFFGLQGATVERREELPPAPPPRPLRLGERTTLDAARDSLGFAPLVPEAAGRPDRVYVDRSVPGGLLSLAYGPRAGMPEAKSTGLGLLVSEFRGDLAPEYAGKIAGGATRVERVSVDGHRALWLEGAPHFFFYRAPDEPIREERLRIAQNVLLLEDGRMLVRFEGAFDLDRALALARSLR
ncbi:MAG TPA: hypothetical protein VFC77_02655 [Myxococcota bacterium]|nr:hypothetical protein [Myxococcota bacterium]